MWMGLGVGGLLFAILALLSGSSGSTTAKEGLFIGGHPNAVDGVRVALEKMAVDIRQNSEAPTFFVYWSESRMPWFTFDADMDRHSLIYNRKTGRLVLGDYGGEGGWGGVTDRMVIDAAQSGDMWKTMARYRCEEWP